MAGVVPGMMIGFGLMIYCYFFGPSGMQKPRAPLRQIVFAAGDAALPLMIPVILLGGILTGYFTPTEAGVVAVIWIIVVVIPALNRGHIKNIPYDFCLAGLIFSLPLITIGAANAFGWMLAYLHGAAVIADWIISLAGNDPHLMMLLLVLLFTVVGDFIEPVPTIIIFMPLVNTLTQAGDINGVHMGVVLIATLAFGLITPPYGLVLLMASKFVGVSFSKALRAALPIYVVFLVTITFTIYFPKVVLWMSFCFRRDDGGALSELIYLGNTPRIARPPKPERRAVTVVDPPAAERFRYRLHHGIVADEQEQGLRVTAEPLADAAQRPRRDRSPRLAVRWQDGRELLHRGDAVLFHDFGDRATFEAAEVAFGDAVVDRERRR